MTETTSWQVGDGATLFYFTDAHAYTVTRVSASGQTITLQRDKATRDPSWKPDFHPGGFVGHVSNDRDQSYTYEPDPDGVVRTARLTKRGWRVGGARGLRVARGRHEFYDSNF